LKLRELDEEWTRLRKKNVTLDEEINELEQNRVLLRMKNMMLDTKIKQLEKEVEEDFVNEKPGKLQSDMPKPKDGLEEYDHEPIGRISWLRLHLTLEGNQDSAFHLAAHVAMKIETVL